MIIAVANLSAPSGTSSLAVRVAADRVQAHGEATGQVLLVTTADASPAHDALDRRASASSEPDVPTAVLPSAKALQMMVPRMAQDYDDIVIDVSGINTSAVRTALVIADLVVMPVEPADAAVEAAGMTRAESDIREFVMTVDMTLHYNPQLRAVAVATDSAEVPDWLVELLQGQPCWQVSSGTRGGLLGGATVAARSAMHLAAGHPVVASVA